MYGVSTITHENYANMEFPPSPVTVTEKQLEISSGTRLDNYRVRKGIILLLYRS